MWMIVAILVLVAAIFFSFELRAWKEAYPDGHDLPFMSDDE